MRLLVLLLVLTACATAPQPPPPDENLWLEDVQSDKALAWVKEQNEQTQKSLEALPSYKRNEKEIREIILAKDRLPHISIRGPYVYNFWQDDKAVRGLWRRATLAEYRRKIPRWEIVIDFDQLAKKEKENWIYKGTSCLPPEFARCLVSLSRGGKDAKVVREFDMHRKAFVENGFTLPEAKSRVSWLDENRILVATDYGPGTLTSSGYPRIVKVWKRGTPLAEAKTIYEGQTSDVSVDASTEFTSKGNKTLVSRSITFYTDEMYEMNADYGLKKIEKPLDAQYTAWVGGQHILTLRSDWKVRGETFKAGSLVALSPIEGAQPKVIFTPNERQSIQSVSSTKDALLIGYFENVQGVLARAHLKGDTWVVETLPFPDKGEIYVHSSSAFTDEAIVVFESFLTPSSIMYARVGIDTPAASVKPEVLRRLPARFNAEPFRVDQEWATSKDGTRVPYFLIRRKDAQGPVPVLLYGYGGFEISQGPYYPSVTGRAWLEKGGAYAIANIRGGGEFGPKWHQAALKENRQKAFDDFIAVAEDLRARKFGSKIAIQGGSNGGLLVGATFVQRPDLISAVICQVPLLDMYRYNKLLAGASWEGEYGNPDDPKTRAAIAKYSPYQNLKADVKYPEVFFITSTADDRVHPGHARKMVARMKAMNHPLLYFENIEGGHSAAANLQQRVKFATLQYTFLQDRLLTKPGAK